MPNLLGYSVYLTSFERQRDQLEANADSGAPVFLSLHMSEEFSDDYCQKAEQTCHWLDRHGYRMIADVSVKTVTQFGESDLIALAKRLGLSALRVDYGFSTEQLTALAAQMPIVLNASTTDPECAAGIARAAGTRVLAMHNFYPRPETGLDVAFFQKRTRALQAAGLKVFAFIPGDEELRGPINEGLPTLERHRGLPPSACYTDLAERFSTDGIFVGDPGISRREQERIQRFRRHGVLELPAELESSYTSLYGRVFTCRPDSPAWTIRFAESREYSCFGSLVNPCSCLPRVRGSITVDNDNYGRYSGELQLMRSNQPADGRVNVIGKVKHPYLLTADCVQNGSSFVLTPD